MRGRRYCHLFFSFPSPHPNPKYTRTQHPRTRTPTHTRTVIPCAISGCSTPRTMASSSGHSATTRLAARTTTRRPQPAPASSVRSRTFVVVLLYFPSFLASTQTNGKECGGGGRGVVNNAIDTRAVWSRGGCGGSLWAVGQVLGCDMTGCCHKVYVYRRA